MAVQELYDKRVKAVQSMRAVLDAADSEDREMTAEETQQYDGWESEVDSLTEQIEKAEADTKRRKRVSELEEGLKQARNQGPKWKPQAAGDDGAEVVYSLEEKVRIGLIQGKTYRQAMRDIASEYSEGDMALLRDEAYRQFLLRGGIDHQLSDRAALQMDVTQSGGTLVMPEQFLARLIQALDAGVFMRQLATIIPMGAAESLGVPSLDTDPSDAEWTTELLIGSEDTSMATGKRVLHPHPLAKYIKVSNTLLRRGTIPVEPLVRERLGYKFRVTEEKGFLSGTGDGEPLGVFTASDDGISTSQDNSTGNTDTTIEADGLIESYYKLESQYIAAGNLNWIFHRDGIKQIRKLKDGEGQYLWRVGIASDRPNTILDVPYFVSEYSPNTFTSGLYVGIIGNFSYYWIAEALTFTLQRLSELYAATNQTGFVGRMELDGMPVLEKAFVRVKLA